MADKTYKMVVTLSNGSTVDAGTFVAPQGPQGPAGPAVSIGDWVSIGESNFTAEANSVYIIRVDGYDGDTALLSTRVALTTRITFFNVTSSIVTITHYIMGSNGKFSKIRIAKIENGKVTFQELTPSSAKDIYYIKLK